MISLRKLRRRALRWDRYYDRYERAGVEIAYNEGARATEAAVSNEQVWRRMHRLGCVGFCDERCGKRIT